MNVYVTKVFSDEYSEWFIYGIYKTKKKAEKAKKKAAKKYNNGYVDPAFVCIKEYKVK